MAKPKKPSKDQIQLGQTVVDFVYAENTDAACFKHFQNMQEIMAFSSDFAEQVKETYPAFYPLHSSLTDSEKEFLRLTIQKQGLKDFINDDLEKIAFGVERYKPETSTLTVLALDFDGEFQEGLLLGGVSGVTPVEMTVDEFKDEIKMDVVRMLPSHIFDGLDEFVKIEEQLSTLKNSISESRINELKEIMSDYEKRGRLHNRIEALQIDLQDLLGDIAENANFDDLPRFGKYVVAYKRLPYLEIPPIHEKSYFDMSGLDSWLSRFETDLAYCLIGFLKPEGNRNYIKKCPTCEEFFIAEDIRRKVCYLKNCKKITKKEYQKEYMRKKRDPDSREFDSKYIS